MRFDKCYFSRKREKFVETKVWNVGKKLLFYLRIHLDYMRIYIDSIDKG